MSKVKKIIVVFFSFITIFALILSVPVSAVEPTVYTVQYQKPVVNEYSGYVEFLSVDGAVYVVTWNFVLQNNVLGTIAPPKITINQSIVSEFYIECSFSDVPEYVHLSYTTTKFNSQNTDSEVWGTYASYAKGDNKIFSTYFAFVPSGAKAVRVNGNAKLNLIGGFTNSTDNWTVVYGDDSSIYYQLEGIKQGLQIGNQGVIDNANQNASQIQQNQDDNTDKIIENQQQMQENEKNEAETQGQGSVDEIGSAIEDKSAGFISAIGSLVNSMSYNGTACAWSFPALKLPAIDGVMPEYQLTQEQPIDFEFWVNKIPSDILLLVRSLLTIALIVYCFKELYSTISYVLTLKGGGNSE